MLINCHEHVWGPRPGPDPFAGDRRVVVASDALGIDLSVVSNVGTPRPATPQGFREANRWMLQCLKEFRGKLWGYCYVNPGWTREALDEIDACMDADPDCVGIKLYNEYKLTDPVVRPVIEKSIERRCPVLIHSGYSLVNLAEQPNITTAGMIAEVARRYPEAKLITGHLGGGGDWEWAIRALAAGPPNAGADISGSVVDSGLVEYAVREIGAERLYFACDISLTAGVGKFQGAALSERDRRLIGSENYLRLVGRSAP